MKIGFMLPAFGSMATQQNMPDMAQLAEERDFESVWVPDHVIMPTKIAAEADLDDARATFFPSLPSNTLQTIPKKQKPSPWSLTAVP